MNSNRPNSSRPRATDETRNGVTPPRRAKTSRRAPAEDAPRDATLAGGAEGLDLEALEASAQERLMALGQTIEEQVRERPYVTLAAALGAGFVLAQALHSRIGRLALLAAGGYAATKVLQGDGGRILSAVLGDDEEDDDVDAERGEPSQA